MLPLQVPLLSLPAVPVLLQDVLPRGRGFLSSWFLSVLPAVTCILCMIYADNIFFLLRCLCTVAFFFTDTFCSSVLGVSNVIPFSFPVSITFFHSVFYSLCFAYFCLWQAHVNLSPYAILPSPVRVRIRFFTSSPQLVLSKIISWEHLKSIPWNAFFLFVQVVFSDNSGML